MELPDPGETVTHYGSAHSNNPDSGGIETGLQTGEAYGDNEIKTGRLTGPASSIPNTGDFAPDPVMTETRARISQWRADRDLPGGGIDTPEVSVEPSDVDPVTSTPDTSIPAQARQQPAPETSPVDPISDRLGDVASGVGDTVSDVGDRVIDAAPDRVQGGLEDVRERVEPPDPEQLVDRIPEPTADVGGDRSATEQFADATGYEPGAAVDRYTPTETDVSTTVGEGVEATADAVDYVATGDDGINPPAEARDRAVDVSADVSDAVEAGAWELTGGDTGAFGEEGVSPSAEMAYESDDALEARAEQEQEILGWRDADGIEGAPAAVAGGLFGVGQEVSQAGIETSEQISSGVAQLNPFSGMGPTLGQETLGSTPENLAGEATAFGGMAVGSALQLPASTAADIQDARQGEETPTEAAGGAGATTAQFVETQAEAMASHPFSTAAGFALPSAGGATSGIRGYRATRGTKGRVEWGDITTEKGERGASPTFDTDTGAPTGEAIGELETRMADQPEAVTAQTGGEGVLFHSTSEPFDSRVDVGEGASEYPGLFTSPEASPLGLSAFDGGYTGPSVGFGDYSTTPEAVPGFRPRGFDEMPGSAAEPGYAVRNADGDVVETGLSRAEANRIADEIGGERATDPTTAGYEYLTEEAPTETGIVRPPGDRTSEMEAIYAPDSEFGRVGGVGVELPDGRVVRSDLYDPVGEPARARGAGDGVDADVDGVETAREISSRTRRSRTSEPDVAVENVFGSAAGVGSDPGVDSGSATRTRVSESDSGAPPRDSPGDGYPAGRETDPTEPGTSGGPGSTSPPAPGYGGGSSSGVFTDADYTTPFGSPPSVSGTSSPPGSPSSPPPSSSPPSGSSGPPGSSSPPPSSSSAPPSSSSSPPGGTGEGAPPGATPGTPPGTPNSRRAPRPRDRERGRDRDREEYRREESEPTTPLFGNPVLGLFDGGDGGIEVETPGVKPLGRGFLNDLPSGGAFTDPANLGPFGGW